MTSLSVDPRVASPIPTAPRGCEAERLTAIRTLCPRAFAHTLPPRKSALAGRRISMTQNGGRAEPKSASVTTGMKSPGDKPLSWDAPASGSRRSAPRQPPSISRADPPAVDRRARPHSWSAVTIATPQTLRPRFFLRSFALFLPPARCPAQRGTCCPRAAAKRPSSPARPGARWASCAEELVRGLSQSWIRPRQRTQAHRPPPTLRPPYSSPMTSCADSRRAPLRPPTIGTRH